MSLVSNLIVRRVIGCAIDVHRQVGPGLFERVYERCLATELRSAGLRVEQQVPLRLTYRGTVIPCVYRVDLIVERTVLVEVKAVDRVLSVHNAQVMTYLRLSGLHHGLLLNFNASTLVEGLRSFVV